MGDFIPVLIKFGKILIKMFSPIFPYFLPLLLQILILLSGSRIKKCSLIILFDTEKETTHKQLNLIDLLAIRKHKNNILDGKKLYKQTICYFTLLLYVFLVSKWFLSKVFQKLTTINCFQNLKWSIFHAKFLKIFKMGFLKYTVNLF